MLQENTFSQAPKQEEHKNFLHTLQSVCSLLFEVSKKCSSIWLWNGIYNTKITRAWISSKNWDLPQSVSQLKGEGTAHKLSWAPSKPFSCQIWKHLHTILKSNLEFLIHGGNRLSYSISPAINLPLAGEVWQRLEALALKQVTFQFFLFSCEWRVAYVSLATARVVSEDNNMTKETDRKVRINSHVTVKSHHLREHPMIYICVLILIYFKIIGLALIIWLASLAACKCSSWHFLYTIYYSKHNRKTFFSVFV